MCAAARLRNRLAVRQLRILVLREDMVMRPVNDASPRGFGEARTGKLTGVSHKDRIQSSLNRSLRAAAMLDIEMDDRSSHKGSPRTLPG